MSGLIQDTLLYLTITVLTLMAILYAYCFRLYRYFKVRGYPHEPSSFPFGNLLLVITLRESYSSFLVRLYEKFKGEEFVGFFQFGVKSVLIVDIELIKNVLVKDFDHFDQKSIYHDKEREPLSCHLFMVGGNEWRVLRKKLAPAYSTGKIKGIFSTVTDVSNELNEYVAKMCRGTDEIECKDLFMRYGLRIIVSTAFGLDTDVFNDENSAFAEKALGVVHPTPFAAIKGCLVFFGRDVAKALKILTLPKECHDFFYNLIRDAVKFRDMTKTCRNDLLQLMIDMKGVNNGDSGLTLDEIAAQSFIFLIAGFETVSNTMGILLYELAMNPDIQKNVLDEVDSVEEITYQTLSPMIYLDMVICETLRKHSSLGFVLRECSRDYVTPGGRLIEKGTQVLVSVRGLHYDPNYFPDPDVFDPERFSKERKNDFKLFSYMPFGEGPRQCIGMRFGQLVVKAGLASLLRAYRVEPCSRTPHPLRYEVGAINTTVEGDLWLRFVPRKSAASS